MLSRDYRDIVGGILLAVLGLAFSSYAAANYELGTLRRMGPGMFPTSLGIVLAAFGLVIAVPAFFRSGKRPEVRIWTPIFVLAGVAAFAITIIPFGLIPAVLCVVVISSFAELRIKPFSLSILSTALCIIAWLVFRVGLGLPVAMFWWPY
jgi:hypothetical protein